jgi:hypothetical protein
MDEEKKKIPLADEEIEKITERLRAKRTVEVPVEAGPVLSKSSAEKKPVFSVIKNLRTYQGDVAEIIKSQNASVLSVTLAEKKKKEVKQKAVKERKEEVVSPPEKRKNFLTILSSIIFLLIGGGLLLFFLTIQDKSGAVFEETPSVTRSIIAFNEKKDFNFAGAERESVLGIVKNERESWNGARGNILFINLTGEDGLGSVGVENFLSTLRISGPGQLLRALDETFMLGIYRGSSNLPFLLLTVSSFENAFDGMLKWEATLYNDLGALLYSPSIPPSLESQETPTNEIDATPLSDFSDKVRSEYEDITIKNKDARVLRNERGDTVLLYSFLSKQIILIAGSEEVFTEFISRAVSSSFTR